MTKKIPGSSLKLVVVSFHLLFIVSLILGIFLYNYGFVAPKPGQIPWTLNKFGLFPILLLIVANITVFFVVVADVLAIKRERPNGAKLVLLIISLIIFGFMALFTILNLFNYLALVLLG